MASNGQTNTNREELVSAMNKLDRSLQTLKGVDAWLDEVEDINAKIGCKTVIDRDLEKRVASNMVSLYAQAVVDASKK